MNIEGMANYADVIGGIAVIVSLIYVGIQIRRNTRSTRAQTFQSAHESLASVALEIAKNPELALLAKRGLTAFDQLNDDDQFQFSYLVIGVMRHFENYFYQHERGMLEDELWEGQRESILSYFHSKGVQCVWKDRRLTYSPAFRQWLESSLAEDVKAT